MGTMDKMTPEFTIWEEERDHPRVSDLSRGLMGVSSTHPPSSLEKVPRVTAAVLAVGPRDYGGHATEMKLWGGGDNKSAETNYKNGMADWQKGDVLLYNFHN